MAFTSWAAEKTKVENQIADLNERLAMQSLSGPDRQLVQRSLDQVTKYYDWVCEKAGAESSTAANVGVGGGRMNVVNFP